MMSQIKLEKSMQADLPVSDGRLRKIWEIPCEYRCPVIGTCLTTEEHKKVVKKAGFRTKELKSYEIHQIIMSHLYNENALSRRVDNLLRNKYKETVTDMRLFSEDQIKAEWSKSFQAGYFDDVFYLIAIMRGISSDTLQDVFGEIHMLSHVMVNQESKACREIRTLKKNLARLELQNGQYKKHNRELKREKSELQAEKSDLKTALSKNQLTVKNHEPTEEEPCLFFKADNRISTAKEKQFEKENSHLAWKCNRLEEENSGLKQRVEEYDKLNIHLKGDIEDLISHFSHLSEDYQAAEEKDVPNNLLLKKVLIVGGMTKIKHLYQHLIESKGGSFEYHDGCLKNGSKNLKQMISRSDLILCPVNCNSHNACYKVKKLCKKHNKALKILSNSSVNSISTALFSDDSLVKGVEKSIH